MKKMVLFAAVLVMLAGCVTKDRGKSALDRGEAGNRKAQNEMDRAFR